MHVCRSIAADVAKKEVQRTVLGVVQPGDSIPVPYGWQRAGEGSVRHCVCVATHAVLQLLGHAGLVGAHVPHESKYKLPLTSTACGAVCCHVAVKRWSNMHI